LAHYTNVINESLGNGLRTVRGFDAVTGLIDFIQSGPGGGATRQDLGFTWNAVGSLTQRQDVRLSLTENFGYDHLHRLTSITGPDPRTMTYDALGNLASKSGVGSYTYHPTKKHAVTAAGSNTYGYDANGNMSSRNGFSISWYSYNLPNLINGPSGNSSQFFYAPDRSRFKQLASYAGTSEQTIYIGGLVEKVTLGTVTSWKHYITGGTGAVAEYIRRSSGTNETVYPLKDHLGSVDMLTNSAGFQMSRLSFDAWGKRRNGGAWNGNPAASAWTTITNTTRRGFTFHEMLDNLNLTHMNGRVYDPVLGRFLSADPFVPDPALTQSYNRYSYVRNDPLSFTDPSGFMEGVTTTECSSPLAIKVTVGADVVACLQPMVLESLLGWGNTGTIEGVVSTASRIQNGAEGGTQSQQRCVRQPQDDGFTFNDFVDFSAGLGDALLLGFGDDIRGWLDIGSVDTSSTAYDVGSWSSFAFGAGRLGYAALAKGYSVVAPSGAAASAFRSSMRLKNAPVRDLSKYGTDAQLRAAAGRTNPYVNAYGAGVAAAGAYDANGCP